MKTQDSSIRLLHLFVPNGSFKGLYKSLEFPNVRGTLFWVLIMRILLFRILYYGPLFPETPF